ncbi:MAG: FAD-dependent oxidoreductase [Acidimicrobiia bacterium]
MAVIVVVGDGPGGLSAALFLAKNGHQVTVFGTDQTAMHHAYLYNYLGIPEIPGSELQEVARRQVTGFGATLRDEKMESVARDGNAFAVTTEAGETVAADYLVLTEGKNPRLALELGVDTGEDGRVQVDRDYRSSVDRVYVVGRSARPTRSQAIISAGAGATAALDILAREAGRDVQDWDTPPQEA